MLKIVSKGNFHSIDEFDFPDNKKLGSGSFGTVHLALHKTTVRMYAIKIVPIYLISDQFMLLAFIVRDSFDREINKTTFVNGPSAHNKSMGYL